MKTKRWITSSLPENDRAFQARKRDTFSVFVLDSLGAIYSLTSAELKKCEKGCSNSLSLSVSYTFVITERQAGENAELEGNEGF